MDFTAVNEVRSNNGGRVRGTRNERAKQLRIERAALAEMNVAAEIVSSTAEWYRGIVHEKDMAEHAVDAAWARRNYSIREFYFARDEESKTIGIVSLQHAGDYIYVGYVYVMANAVGRGYGRQLLEHAAEAARARGYKGLSLIAHPEATWAARAYEKFGFKPALVERQDVLAWNDGFLKPFYEEGFVLYQLDV